MAAEAIYIVWCPTGDTPPIIRHQSVDEARRAARDMCQNHPHKEFFVMRAVESVQYRTDPFVCKSYCKR